MSGSLFKNKVSFSHAPAPTGTKLFPTITKRQLKKQLISMGYLPSLIDEYINTIEDPFEREEALADWGANEFDRHHSRVAQFAAILGITDPVVIDDAWFAAAGIV